MDRILIRGGTRLSGEVRASGSKNSTLALMAAALLADGEVILHNVPRLRDIETMLEILRALGASADWESDNQSLRIDPTTLNSQEAPYDLVRKMRASFMVLGPLLARFGSARVSEPGGCAIGVRPVDQHLKGLAALGAKIQLDHGYVEAAAAELRGGRVTFDLTTVNGTQNVMMAATLASGETVIENAAREPEVGDLAQCLAAMGADIQGIGTDTLSVRGVKSLGGAEHRVVSDRIETGTYAMAAAITGGALDLLGARAEHLRAVIEVLGQAGVAITESNRGLHVERADGRLQGVDVMTEPFPGFPTDLQAQMMALMATAEGASMITETIFENRFMHVPELARMGADINVAGASAMVRGVERLAGAEVMATDLRASSSLVLAGLAADGETLINRVYHLDRGYERIEHKLAACGADIERVTL